MSSSLIEIGKILGNHGLKGQLKVSFFSGNQVVLRAGMSCQIKSNSASIYNVAEVSHGPKHSLVKFKECYSVEQANQMFLPGEVLLLERSQFPQLDAGEVYLSDLIGLEIYRDADETKAWSKVIGSYHNGIQDILQCQCLDGSIVDLPFVRPLISQVDLNSRKIIALPLEWED